MPAPKSYCCDQHWLCSSVRGHGSGASPSLTTGMQRAHPLLGHYVAYWIVDGTAAMAAVVLGATRPSAVSAAVLLPCWPQFRPRSIAENFPDLLWEVDDRKGSFVVLGVPFRALPALL